MLSSSAKSWTIVAQCATMGLVGVAGFVAVMGIPGVVAPDSQIPPMPTVDVAPQTPTGQPALVDPADVEMLSMSFRALPNAPKVEEIEIDMGEGADIGSPNPPTLLAFMGAVISTNHRAAMLKANQEKAWITEGTSAVLAGKDIELLEVRDDAVRLRVDGFEQTLDRKAREGTAVSRVAKPSEIPGSGRDPDYSARRRLEDARGEMMSPSQDPLLARRNSANALLDRADALQATNPDAAARLRERAEKMLSLDGGSATPQGAATGASMDPER